MADNPVLRVNSDRECGLPVGQITVKLKLSLTAGGFEVISFYCNQPNLHRDACKFEGSQVVVYGKTR